jgi:hypothetical protein
VKYVSPEVRGVIMTLAIPAEGGPHASACL